MMGIFNIFSKKSEPKPVMGQVGIVDTSSSGSTGQSLNSQTIADMKRDETIAAGLRFISSSTISKIGSYSNPDSNVAQFVSGVIENLEISLPTFLKKMLEDMLAYGWAGAEIVWQSSEGKLWIEKVVSYAPSQMSFYPEEAPEYVKLTTSKGEFQIPMSKMFVLRNGEGLYGESILNTCYRAWDFKRKLFKIWAIGLDKYALPIIHGKTENISMVDANGNPTTSVEVLNEILSNFYSKTAVSTDKNTEIALLEANSKNLSDQFRAAIEYANTLIYRNLGLPQLLLTNEYGGAYALGKVHIDMVQSSTQSMAEVISDSFLDNVVAKLIDYNFPSVESYGELAIIREQTLEERKALAVFVETIGRAGIMDNLSDADRRWARALLSMPEEE